MSAMGRRQPPRRSTKEQAAHPLHIRRDEAFANRRASLKGIPTKPGFDRDE
jgi:hypothetical protein